jgi:hypothetical protein
MHILDGKVAAPHAGLVRDNKEFEPGILQTLQRGANAGIDDDLLGTMEIITVLDERAVSIQKHRAIHGGGASGKPAAAQRGNGASS